MSAVAQWINDNPNIDIAGYGILDDYSDPIKKQCQMEVFDTLELALIEGKKRIHWCLRQHVGYHTESFETLCEELDVYHRAVMRSIPNWLDDHTAITVVTLYKQKEDNV